MEVWIDDKESTLSKIADQMEDKNNQVIREKMKQGERKREIERVKT